MDNYNTILDNLVEMVGGKEYCIKNLISETDYKMFLNEYRNKKETFIYNLLEKFYPNYDKSNIIEVDVLSNYWIPYFMKLHYYDYVHFKFFEFSIKNNTFVEIPTFSTNELIISKSFYLKIRNGYELFDKYENSKNANMSDDKKFFNDKMKICSHVESAVVEPVVIQYPDNIIRFTSNNIFYYQFPEIDGYITFHDEVDLMLEPIFVKNFYEHVIKKVKK